MMQKKRWIKRKYTKFIIFLIISSIPWFIIFLVTKTIETQNNTHSDVKILNYDTLKVKSPVNHTDFEILKQKFTDPSQVTEACLTCHNQRHKEVMGNAHWAWGRENIRENGDTVFSGKNNIVNNYCIATNTNSWKCTSCHIGYGWDNKDFDLKDYKRIDCLACHDTTGAYEKEPLGAGYPVKEKQNFADKTYFPPDYNFVATHVGKPDIDNCGKCHFFGGGGNNVKHGDLSSDLYHADKYMDVHMDESGNDMTCTDCHETKNHVMKGKLVSVSDMSHDRLSCEKCHEGDIHSNNVLNRHSQKIACQTCHIPEYAKGIPTKLEWNWGDAGKLDKSGHKITEKDSMGNVIYATPKGTFKWGTHVIPEYIWFNGKADQYVYGDKIEDTTKVLQMIKLAGSYDDPNAKIIPVKIHRGTQIFDTENMTLIIPHIYGHDSTAYSEGLNWDIASKKGMEYAGLPYSGKYSFIKTEAAWPLNHMVSPAENALQCIDCHSKDGRLANLDGFYMPGRDNNNFFDTLGILFIIASFLGVLVHSIIRIKKKKNII